MKNLEWLRVALHSRVAKDRFTNTNLTTSSEVFEALLYLRRAAQLLSESGALHKTHKRVNAAIAEMELVIRPNSEPQNEKL